MTAQLYSAELDVLTTLHRQLISTRHETEKYRDLMQQGVNFIEHHHAKQALDNIYLMRENDELKQRIAVLEAKLSELESNVTVSFKESQRLFHDNATLLKIMQVKDDEIQDLKRKVDSHVHSHKTTYNLLKQVDHERTSALVERSKVSDDLRSMKQKLASRHEVTWAAEQQVTQLTEELAKVKQELVSVKSELKYVKGETTLIELSGSDCVRLTCVENKRILHALQQRNKRIITKYPHLAKDFEIDGGGGGGGNSNAHGNSMGEIGDGISSSRRHSRMDGGSSRQGGDNPKSLSRVDSVRKIPTTTTTNAGGGSTITNKSGSPGPGGILFNPMLPPLRM